MSKERVTPAGPQDSATPIFVDDSGRRRTRIRVASRALVAVLGAYVALVAFGLTGTLSLPIVHLGELRHLPSESRRTTLGARSRQVPLPAALTPAASGDATPSPATVRAFGPGRNPVTTTTSRGSAQLPSLLPTVPRATPQRPTPPGRVTTTTAFVPPTTVPAVTTTTPPNPPTTRHGNGPPTSIPGKGKGP